MITMLNESNTQQAAKVQILSMPNLFLRLEGLAFLIAAMVSYAHLGGSIWLFLLLILAPDVAMVGYLVNVNVGSITYNIVHFYALPVSLAAIALAVNAPTVLLIALIWFAHISMDRVAGYGLKYPTEFKDTHMQHV